MKKGKERKPGGTAPGVKSIQATVIVEAVTGET